MDYDEWYKGTMRDGSGVASLKTVTGQNQNFEIVNVWTLDEFSSVCLYFGPLFFKSLGFRD